MERKYSKISKSKPDLWKEQAANLPGQKSVLVLLFKQTRKQNGEDSSFFFKKKKHKILPRQRLTASCLWHRNYLGRVIMKSIKAANHILEIQKQELIQGEVCLFINAFTHHQEDQRGCVQIPVVPPAAYLFLNSHSTRTLALSWRPYQLASPPPSASVGSPSWPFSGPSLLDQMVPSMKMRAHSEQLL